MGASLKTRLTPDYIAPCEGGKIYLYRVGGLSMSVCAPGSLIGSEVASAVDRHYPCGTTDGWVVSKYETFKGGEPNPCVCHEDSTRKHWYLEA